jgi:CubicO group peptidase (beta-lactamase class C family)
LLVVLVAVLLVLTGCQETPRPASSPGPYAEQIAASHALLDHLAADQPGCSFAVGHEGKLLWAYARGLADLDSRRAITTESIFEVFSVTKQFTATAVLLLVGEGSLDLRTPVSRYLTGLPDWSETVTLSHLLHHTSGIPEYVDVLLGKGKKPEDSVTQADIYRAITTMQLSGKPGEQFAYSNSNYVLLAHVVAEVSGQAFETFVEQRILQPHSLAMTFDSAIQPGQVPGYVKKEDGTFAKFIINWRMAGDAGLKSTPTELVRWADNYRTGLVGGEELLRRQTDAAVDTLGFGGYFARYGAGIFLQQDGALTHGGGGDTLTEFAVLPSRRLAVALACNSNAGMDIVFDGLFSAWADADGVGARPTTHR